MESGVAGLAVSGEEHLRELDQDDGMPQDSAFSEPSSFPQPDGACGTDSVAESAPTSASVQPTVRRITWTQRRPSAQVRFEDSTGAGVGEGVGAGGGEGMGADTEALAKRCSGSMVTVLVDESMHLTRSLGMSITYTDSRSKRYAMVVKDGMAKAVWISYTAGARNLRHRSL